MGIGKYGLVFIENVGNLVCPTHWALGEQIKLCLLSMAAGLDKPVQYPEVFAVSDVMVLNAHSHAVTITHDSEHAVD